MKKDTLQRALLNSNLSADTLNNLSAYTLNNLSAYTLNNLSAYTLNNLSAYTLNNLSAYTLNNLSADTLKNLSADTLKNLSAYTLNNLSADTLKNLSADTLNNLSADTLNNLSADTLKNLSADTLKKLIKEEEIPTTPNFYTDLKSGFDSKTITYKQSTFGDYEDFSEDVSLHECGIAMCIGGFHKVAGGKLGFDLIKKVGYESGATLMHLKTYPDTPVFNYMSTNNSDGIAYIEMMSSFEQRENKDLDFIQWLEIEMAETE